MSEDDKQPPKPPKPMKKTSSVPLKKETVRVTLKSGDDASKGGDQKKPPAPSPPKTSAPAPTIPLKSAPKPDAGKGDAPKPDGPKKPGAPAPTVQLKSPGGGGGTAAPKTTPLKTQPLSTPGQGKGAEGGDKELPKATVKLGSATQGLGTPTGLSAGQPNIQTAADDDDDEGSDTVATALSVGAFVLALVVLFLQFSATSQWVSQDDPVNNESGWNALFE